MQNQASVDCVFCRILLGNAPAHVVKQNALAVSLLDINPLAKGHCLVIPRRHVPWWHELSPEENTALFVLAQETAASIMAAYKPDFVAMYARGRRIPHTHIFLVPTAKGDPVDRHFNALEGFQEAIESLAHERDPQVLAETLDRLKSSDSK
jgi:histidine triad (HIT) family protein